MAAEPLVLKSAVVVPPVVPRYKQKTGILTQAGDYVGLGATHRLGATLTLKPDKPVQTVALEGKWLWAGSLYDHFGHFLIESCSRLWNWHSFESALDGILFVPKFPNRPDGLTTFQEAVIKAWGVDGAVAVAGDPTTVEQLVVFDQAIGLGARISGTPGMRSAARSHFARNIKGDGPERLFVSRSRLNPSGGAILVEPEIEVALARDGYQIFHPQEHCIETQISRYKAAKHIIFSDGSPAHLFAYCAMPEQKVAYLPRRRHWLEGPIDHISAFQGTPPLLLPSPVREWLPQERRKFRNVSYCLHDLEQIGEKLAEAGFISTHAGWKNLENEEVKERVSSIIPDRSAFAEN